MYDKAEGGDLVCYITKWHCTSCNKKKNLKDIFVFCKNIWIDKSNGFGLTTRPASKIPNKIPPDNML